MKARKVYEAIGDILTPKSKSEIRKDIRNLTDPDQIIKIKIKEACEDYWKRIGVKFGKPNQPEIVGYGANKNIYNEISSSSSKLYDGKPFIPQYANVKGTQMGVFNELYGRFMLKNGKWSNNVQAICYKSINEI